MLRLTARILAATLLFAFAVGCNETGFTPAVATDAQSDALPDEAPPICDPFSNGGKKDPTKGIRGTLHYYEVGDPRISSIKNSLDFIPGVPGVVSSPNPVYLNQLDVPTRAFSDGFVGGDGQLLRTANGDALIEWFSLRMASNLTAPTALDDGEYQFAMNSDDGALLKVDTDGDGVYEPLVDDDTIHSPHMKCATRTVTLKNGKLLPFTLDYFQGPRVLITLQVLWKRIPAGGMLESTCDLANFTPVPAAAFELDPGRPNPCAK